MMEWDVYFHEICKIVASKSPCLSRKIGAILVKDHSIVSTGYNGPPRGIPHCGHARFMKDATLIEGGRTIDTIRFSKECPRKVLGYSSGEGMEWCPAQHAEENAVSNAARLGVSVLGATLYMNSIIPCQKCFGTLINAGIEEIVVDSAIPYDKFTLFLINNSNIRIRAFDLGGTNEGLGFR
jgi:dCMP deaminase